VQPYTSLKHWIHGRARKATLFAPLDSSHELDARQYLARWILAELRGQRLAIGRIF